MATNSMDALSFVFASGLVMVTLVISYWLKRANMASMDFEPDEIEA